MALRVNLNKHVTIQRRGTGQDSVGQAEEAWGDVTTVWASIQPISGRNYFNASGERAEVTHQIMTRYGPDIAVRDRVVIDKRIFEIRAVLNMEDRDRYLQLMVTEHVT
jgi:SPP1 family predicted phage head-tail adaptor